MTRRAEPIRKRVEVTLNASGAGTARIGPTMHGVTWQIDSYVVKCSTATNEATARLYVNGVIVDTTETGSTGDTGDIPVRLQSQDVLTCTWESGDVGATAELTVSGTQFL